MAKKAQKKEDEISIESLYPGFSKSELEEIEDTWDRYVSLMLRIYERLESDPEAYAQFRTLTGL